MKEFLVSTPLYKPMLKARSIFEEHIIKGLGPREGKVNTAYCISPYKSGTTYFSGLFSEKSKSNHEPFMYTTIRNMDDTSFLVKRARWLDLDLECSGFFAGKLQVLRSFAPESPVIFLSRHPETWIGSVVNYFSQLKGKVSYNYVARLIFDPLCDYPVDEFYDLEDDKKKKIVENLIEYWISIYLEAELDPLSIIVPLDEVDSRLKDISQFLGLPYAPPSEVWKRENRKKKEFSLSDYVDINEYEESVQRFGYKLK
ncbi:hypothetical protein [Alloalcanivorax xenomutans]|uniref:hypothetical protein n=1 Tax=Alloalcanivorax xenomutans TaxID=1094342 RepID=UPI00300B9D3B